MLSLVLTFGVGSRRSPFSLCRRSEQGAFNSPLSDCSLRPMTSAILFPRFVALALLGMVPAAFAGVLVSTDFSATLPTDLVAESSGGVGAIEAMTDDGTIDTYQGKRGSALTPTADFTRAASAARAGLLTPTFSVAHSEPDLAKLTLGFGSVRHHPKGRGPRPPRRRGPGQGRH